MRDERDLSLLETLDHLLDRGVVIAGEATISIAGVDLLYLGLNVVLANVDTLMRVRGQKAPPLIPDSSLPNPRS